MAQAMIENSAFTKLDMPVNECNPVIKRYTKFDAKLDLSLNERHLNVKSVGTAALAQALKENSTLSRYDLSGHECGHVCAVALAQGLKENSTQLYLLI